MPAIRRVSARRDMRARLRAVYPLAVAASEALMLPDRNGRLQVVDEGAACLERGGAVTAGHGDHDGKIADRQVTNPVHGGDRVQIESLRDLLGDLAQLVRGRRVSRIRELGHGPAVIMITDCPLE